MVERTRYVCLAGQCRFCFSVSWAFCLLSGRHERLKKT